MHNEARGCAIAAPSPRESELINHQVLGGIHDCKQQLPVASRPNFGIAQLTVLFSPV